MAFLLCLLMVVCSPRLEPLLMSLLQDRVPLAEQYMYLFWSSPSVSDTIKQMKAMVQVGTSCVCVCVCVCVCACACVRVRVYVYVYVW